jgi:uncharacterized protein
LKLFAQLDWQYPTSSTMTRADWLRTIANINCTLQGCLPTDWHQVVPSGLQVIAPSLNAPRGKAPVFRNRYLKPMKPSIGPAVTSTLAPVDKIRSSTSQRFLALAALAALAISCVLPPREALSIRSIPVIAGAVFATAGLVQPGPGGTVSIVAFAIEALVLAGVPWLGILPIGLALLFLGSRHPATSSHLELHRGIVPGWQTFACAAVTPVFLVGWTVLLKPDVADFAQMVPRLEVPLLVIGSVGFAATNALFEEWIWRGVFQKCLADLYPLRVAIGTQALSFGIAHAHGFPRGVTGVVLAGVWAVLLGLLRAKSRGLFAPFLAHFVADMTIAQLLIFWFQ